MKEYPIIFNQVLGPVTPGPSSSSTGGPGRLGLLCRDVLGEEPKKVLVEFPESGPWKRSYIGMNSDRALICGLLGRKPPQERFAFAREDAKAAGMDISFTVSDFAIDGYNQGLIRITMDGKNGAHHDLYVNSTGGGTVWLQEIDGVRTDIRGNHYELLLFTGRIPTAEMQKIATLCAPYAKSLNGMEVLEGTGEYNIVELKTGEPFDAADLEKIAAIDGVQFIRVLEPVFPVVLNKDHIPPFETAEEMVEYAKKNNLNLYQCALEYESAMSGWTKEAVHDYGKFLWGVITHSIEAGMKREQPIEGYVEASAYLLEEHFEKKKGVSMGALDYGIPAAQAVMEYANSVGVVVCLPTGGSAGVVPGALYGAMKQLDLTEEDMIEGLLAAGMIGGIMARETNFSGSWGCQAEVGSATALAAGGLTHVLGGDVQQCCDAASMALQALLGLVCDSVGGKVQVPCMARNIGAVSVAVACSNSVLAGFPAFVPFSEMITCMVRVGAAITTVGKTCGTCMTPTGIKMTEESPETAEQGE
ncbi:L-serine ammonia-lyase, iron-sulfur-dependent, subunit alpha [Eubacteriales bacterium OttesenSCG-928-M02]|nr:L-serine ammonia-lyase, iron-sulfur-dependent, subunit alpha [Eubacteriales bacterium OttesenSCG-928-M02]